MLIKCTAQISPVIPASNQKYREHLTRQMKRLREISAVVMDPRRIDFIDDVLGKMTAAPVDHPMAVFDLNKQPTPSEIEGEVIRTSGGVCVLFWPAEHLMVSFVGAPSLGVAAKVKLVQREHVTQKMKAAEKSGATWIHPDIIATLQISKTTVGPTTVSFPLIVLNSAFFKMELIEPGIGRREDEVE